MMAPSLSVGPIAIGYITDGLKDVIKAIAEHRPYIPSAQFGTGTQVREDEAQP